MGAKISTREAYGRALCEIGSDTRIIVLEADLSICTMSGYFGEAFPDRYFNVGIAEANMIDMAAGFATTGCNAFCHSFAMFTAGRGYEQIRNSVAYPHLNVKVIGSHAGLTVGRDGATHQCIEDLSLMRTIPGMVVLSPCDATETRYAVKALATYEGPVFMRTSRIAFEDVISSFPTYQFEIGKGVELVNGNDLTLCATGLMVQVALKAQKVLSEKGLNARVIDMHTIKPLDQEIICKAAKETGAILTVEEHNIIGGLGSAVAETVGEWCPIPIARVGVNDTFGRSGEADELLELYGLNVQNIVLKAMDLYTRKKGL